MQILIFVPWLAAIIGAAVYTALTLRETPRAWGEVIAYVIYAVLVCCLWTAFALWHVGLV